MSVVIFNADQVRDRLTMAEAIPLAHEAFLALARGQVTMPQRLAIRVPDHQGTHLSMPCYVKTPDREILIVKVVTVFESNGEFGKPVTLGRLMLHDPTTGEPLALMDAEALTAIRTGAASALATDFLASRGPVGLGIIGAGEQAIAQAKAMFEVRPIERIVIFSRTRARAIAQAVRLQVEQGVEVQVARTAEDVALSCRLICCATNSTTPVLRSEWLQPGTHINAVGAFRTDMAELDAEAVLRARVVVDYLEPARHGAGDLILTPGLDWSTVREIGDVLESGFARTADDITLFKSVGTAVQDAFAADWVFRKVSE
jgi:ornithine cyclodeaminase/alanine dehydrogenase-like protein (mu-crystallin family)